MDGAGRSRAAETKSRGDGRLPPALRGLRLPMVGAPLFIISNPDLVIAQCKAGIVGSFPALNAREGEGEPPALEAWIVRIREELERHDRENPDRPSAPFAVNHIVHRSNSRLQRDIEICARHEVPIWITSLGAREEVCEAAHGCGAVVLHDVIDTRFARKAIEKGADGLIAVAAGAGGHAGPQSPFALIQEIRDWFDGPLLLSGAIATGESLLAAIAAGADLGYVGSPFIATREANASEGYKRMIVDCGAGDIMTSSHFTGVSGNYLRPSVVAAGLDPDNLEPADASKMDFAESSTKAKAWKEIWGAGQGIGAVRDVTPAASLVDRLEREFHAARRRLEDRLGDAGGARRAT